MDILSTVASVALPYFGFYAAAWWCYQDSKSKKRLRQTQYKLEQSQRAHTELTHKFVSVRMEQMGL